MDTDLSGIDIHVYAYMYMHVGLRIRMQAHMNMYICKYIFYIYTYMYMYVYLYITTVYIDIYTYTYEPRRSTCRFEVTHSGSWPTVVRPVLEKVDPWQLGFECHRMSRFERDVETFKIFKGVLESY